MSMAVLHDERRSTEYAGILPAVPFLFGILLYNILTLSLQKLIAMASPNLFNYLSKNRAQRLDPFLAFAIGWLITFFSAPICTIAALDSTPKARLFDQTIEPTILEQTCVATRVVLWVGEIPRLQFSSMYTAHHVFSIAAFLGIVHIRAPIQQLFVLYAALCTELFSTAIALLKVLGWKARDSKGVRAATYVNILLLLSIRVPSTCWSIWLVVSSGMREMRIIANVGPLLIYVLYLLYCAYRQSQTLGIIDVDWRAPAHIRVFGTFGITLYAVCLLCAWVAVTLSSMWLYSMSSAEPLRTREAQDIMLLAFRVAIAGLIGAASLPRIVGAKRLPRGKRPTCASRGLWLQAGELAMVLALFFSRFGNAYEHRALFCAVSLSLPLGEAIGRLGCYFGGCCGGRQPKGMREANDPLVESVPLTSMCINGIIYVLLASVTAIELLDLEHTACLAVAFNGMTRIFTDSLREDVPRLRILAGQSPTTVFASFQGFSGFFIFSRLNPINDMGSPAILLQYPRSLLAALVLALVSWPLTGPSIRRKYWQSFSRSIGATLAVSLRPLVLSSLAALMLGAIVLVEGYKIRVTGANMND